MKNLLMLIPFALILGGIGLVAFLWALRSGQFEDLDGAANRILFDYDDPPPPAPPSLATVSASDKATPAVSDKATVSPADLADGTAKPGDGVGAVKD